MNPTLGTSQNWGGKKKNKENHCFLVSAVDDTFSCKTDIEQSRDRFISSLTFTKFDLTNLPQYHLMLCSLRWSRDQHSLVSLFPMRPVVLSMHYLALKRLLSATRRILNEGDARWGPSVQPAKRLQQSQWAGLPQTWWACQCVMIDIYRLSGSVY